MAAYADPLAKLQEYAAKVKETDYVLDAAEPEVDYGLRVNKTLQSLQNQVKELEAAIKEVCCHSLRINAYSPNLVSATGK